MKSSHFLLFACMAIWNLPVSAQIPSVQAAIDAVSMDTLMQDLRHLSGEDPVNVGNGDELIVNRNKNSPGNALAADWLQQRILQLGLTPSVQTFGSLGENIIAVKTGALHPGRKVVVCGHYDAMPGGPVAAPAADDDGSGTVTVLEALRVLAPLTFENTIVFAMWDEEEQGLIGSHYFAGAAAGNDDTLTAVVNLDAISYDGDGDGLLRVHTKPIANSIAIKDSALMVNTTYGLNLPIAVNNPGATYSDHASFWSEGYGAILIIEDFDNDGNPHYHTPTDLVDYIDQPYWQGLAQLGIGTTAVLARPMLTPTAVMPSPAAQGEAMTAYPNPTTGITHVRVNSVATGAGLALFDAIGSRVLPMDEGMLPVGQHAFDLDMRTLTPGAYILRSMGGGSGSTFRLMRIP